MIASTLLFGLGVALLRKHTYRIYEPVTPSSSPEQSEKPLGFLAKLK
jgi:hypothetical protein